MYLDTDPILALLKPDDWLASAIDLDDLEEPKTSVATSIEVQYAMEDDWSPEQLAGAHRAFARERIEQVTGGCVGNAIEWMTMCDE